MKNNKLLGIILWFIGLIIETALLLCLTKAYSAPIWVTFGFTLFAFTSQLVLWLYVWHGSLTVGERFLHMPLFTLSVRYLLLQVFPCIIFALWQAPVQIAILVNVALAVVMWILLILAMIAKSHIEKVDSRQKNHHKEL